MTFIEWLKELQELTQKKWVLLSDCPGKSKRYLYFKRTKNLMVRKSFAKKIINGQQ